MQITNKGIRTVLKDIESGHLILPALQRLFLLHNDGKIQKSTKLF